jgi:predicted RNase H-like HicB family nuclease
MCTVLVSYDASNQAAQNLMNQLSQIQDVERGEVITYESYEDHLKYTAIVKEVGNGWYMGQCEQVPGAITQGKTRDEVKENLKEAIALVLESQKAHCKRTHLDKKIIRRKTAVA